MQKLVITVVTLWVVFPGVAAAASRSDVHQADLRLAVAQRSFARAQASRDPAAIAAERAKVAAARAIAWGRRHPAPVPTTATAR
jgi:hypothetical protein